MPLYVRLSLVSFLLAAVVSSIQGADGYLPLEFEQNIGQSDAQVRFLARSAGYELFIKDTETVAVMHQNQRKSIERHLIGQEARPLSSSIHVEPPWTVRMQFRGATGRPIARGENLLDGKSNYFIGNDPSKWRTNVAHYARVRLAEVYPGIDVLYYGKDGRVEYDFLVRPGADPRQIRLHYEGADRIALDGNGDLIMHIHGGEVRQRLAAVYQESRGRRNLVAASFRRLGCCEFGIDVSTYDHALPLVIDPTIIFFTYVGGSSSDSASAIAVDSAGSVYLTGVADSIDFPTVNPFQAGRNGYADVFVTKLHPSGSAIAYSTYLGGSDSNYKGCSCEQGLAIAVDSSGNAYVTGLTASADFPLKNPLQPTSHEIDAFVTKLDSSGSTLVYSTYLGGIGGTYNEDIGHAIAVDHEGNAYVTGLTNSSNFPTTNAFQAAAGGGFFDAFVTKLNASGSAFIYSTYLGGKASDWGNGIAVDGSGYAYVTGYTSSADFPTASPIQPTAFTENVFVTKLSPAGSTLVYSTYLSGPADSFPIYGTEGVAIALDIQGNAYITGYTYSDAFPTVNAVQPTRGGSIWSDAFVTKVSASGSALIYSTYLGGSGVDGARGIAVDTSGNAYVTGYSESPEFPLVNPLAVGPGAFVAKFSASGSLAYSTFLGNNIASSDIAVDGSGAAYVTGVAFRKNGNTTFLAKLSSAAELADMTITKTHTTALMQGQIGAVYIITVKNVGPGLSFGSVTIADILPSGLAATSMDGSGWTCNVATLTCTRSDVLTSGASFPPVNLTVNVSANVTNITNSATVSGGGETNTSNNTATDATIVTANPTIPALDARTLIALTLLLAVLGIVALRRG